MKFKNAPPPQSNAAPFLARAGPFRFGSPPARRPSKKKQKVGAMDAFVRKVPRGAAPAAN